MSHAHRLQKGGNLNSAFVTVIALLCKLHCFNLADELVIPLNSNTFFDQRRMCQASKLTTPQWWTKLTSPTPYYRETTTFETSTFVCQSAPSNIFAFFELGDVLVRKHLMSGPTRHFVSPQPSALALPWWTLKAMGNKTHCFPWVLAIKCLM